jgi:hypothetical protein
MLLDFACALAQLALDDAVASTGWAWNRLLLFLFLRPPYQIPTIPILPLEQPVWDEEDSGRAESSQVPTSNDADDPILEQSFRRYLCSTTPGAEFGFQS